MHSERKIAGSILLATKEDYALMRSTSTNFAGFSEDTPYYKVLLERKGRAGLEEYFQDQLKQLRELNELSPAEKKVILKASAVKSTIKSIEIDFSVLEEQGIDTSEAKEILAEIKHIVENLD